MESGMYRLGSSISAGLQQGTRGSSFYRQDSGADTLRGGGARGHVQPEVPGSSSLETKLDEMMSMMSGTQQLLLAQQATTQRLETSVAKINVEVETLQADLKKMSEEASTSKATSKRRVPKELRNCVKKIHSELDKDNQFDGTQSYKSEHNSKIADFLRTQLKSAFDRYETVDINQAVYRYYESRRRNYNDSLPKRKEKVQSNNKKTKMRGYKKRLYERRMKFVKNGEESRKFAEINESYMTDESMSDSCGSDVVRRHKHPWRSDALNKLVAKLDKRADKAQKASPAAKCVTKAREDSSPSTASPPQNAPVWAVKIDYDGTGDLGDEDIAEDSTPQPDPSAVTPASSRSSEALKGRRILADKELRQALIDSDSSSDDDDESD